MTLVLYSILGFLIFENLVELYLTLRQVSLKNKYQVKTFFILKFFSFSQLRVYKTSKQVPAELKDALKEETFEKAR